MAQCKHVSKEHKIDLELGHRVVCGLEEHGEDVKHDLVIRMIDHEELTELRKEHKKTQCKVRTLTTDLSKVFRCRLQETEEHTTHIYDFERALSENELNEIKKIIASKES